MNNAFGVPQSLLVLGGGSDIGLATAMELVRAGTRSVVLAARDPERCSEAATALRDAGASVEVLRFDATEPRTHQTFIDNVTSGFGDIDAALLAWGILGDQGKAEDDAAHALDVIETNFVGAVSVGTLLAQRLREQGHGTIVVLSSVAGERARRSNFVYGSSKAGLDAFFTGLGDALVGTGARVIVVRPGFVVSKMTAGMTPVPFSTTPEAVAIAIRKALASRTEEVWVPAVLRVVMSVLRHVPRKLFRRLPL